MDVLLLLVDVFILDVEHLAEVLAKVMGGGCLQPSSIEGDDSFHSCSQLAACELLFLGFDLV